MTTSGGGLAETTPRVAGGGGCCVSAVRAVRPGLCLDPGAAVSPAVQGRQGRALGSAPTCLAVVAEEALRADAQVGPAAVLAPASVPAGAGVAGVHLWRTPREWARAARGCLGEGGEDSGKKGRGGDERGRAGVAWACGVKSPSPWADTQPPLTPRPGVLPRRGLSSRATGAASPCAL